VRFGVLAVDASCVHLAAKMSKHIGELCTAYALTL
jgi:hypothetical protein